MLKPSPSAVEPVEPVDGFNAPIRVSGRSVFRRAYAFLHNKKVGLFLILATGLLALVGALARQMPASVRLDPAASAAWLDEVRPVFGGWTDIAHAIGVFHIFSSPLFLTVSALLALSIVACTTHRLPTVYRQGFRPRTSVSARFFEHTKLHAQHDSPLDVDRTVDEVAAVIARRRYRVIRDADGTTIYSDRFHWAPLGTAVSHTGYVVIMAGFLVSAVAGFRVDNFDLTVGIPREVGNGTGLTAEAASFADAYDEATGTPIDYVTDLILRRDGDEVARQDVRVNEPLIIDGVYFHQASFGVAAVVRVTGPDGDVLLDGGVPLAWRTPDQRLQYGVEVFHELGLELFVISNASGSTTPGLSAGQVRFEVYPVASREPLGVATVDAGAAASVGDLSVSFLREQKYTSLIVKRDPGSWVVWLGCTLLVVGVTVTLGLRHRRQWVRVTPTPTGSCVQIATTDRPDSIRSRNFHELSTSIASALRRPAD
ncbi:cytochrome c biogenesis protein ResB [Tessaracoccus oleiagri]|uniref:Cytochrome c biogenesis protein n=1 Tax=Tessaracoccus oleiagri TaxID=686624 RepID=A0A1G9H5L8_9ACTN|nr:cytochrome c biogenesis protein ResB [Tessaracoccus oleiagri]SDL08044.1 cytochrome c biogenesis protein [Tessaracoccus oleiagri]